MRTWAPMFAVARASKMEVTWKEVCEGLLLLMNTEITLSARHDQVYSNDNGYYG